MRPTRALPPPRTPRQDEGGGPGQPRPGTRRGSLPPASKSRSTSGKARGGGYARFRRPGGQAHVRRDGSLLPAPGKAMPSRRTQECRAPAPLRGRGTHARTWPPASGKAGSRRMQLLRIRGFRVSLAGRTQPSAMRGFSPGFPVCPARRTPLSCGNPARQGLPCTSRKAHAAVRGNPMRERPARHRPLYAETRCGRGFPVRPARHSRCTAGTRRWQGLPHAPHKGQPLLLELIALKVFFTGGLPTGRRT